MFKGIFKDRITILIEGVNIKRLLKNIIKNDIEIFNLNQNNYKSIEITINAKKYNKIKLLLTNFRYKTIKNTGLSFVKQFSFSHLGIIIGFVAFLMLLFLNANFVSTIYINGTERINNNEIVSFLKSKNIKTNTFFTSFDNEELEAELENKFTDISFCSVIRKGTNIIINIKEKLYAEDILESFDIISQFNGQILSLSCNQGTPLVKVGDSVKAGEILIAGYIENGDTKVNCKAIGKVTMKVWYTSSYEFFNEEIKKVKTNKVIVNSYYKIFNTTIKIKEKKPDFNYEKETSEEYLFKNNILPIKIYKEKFYEIQENFIKNDFSIEKDDIINKTMNEAKGKVPENVEIINSFSEISDTQTGKIVTCYVETIQSFT